jgi:hypothetical protein
MFECPLATTAVGAALNVVVDMCEASKLRVSQWRFRKLVVATLLERLDAF